MINTLNKLGIEGMYLNMKKAIVYDKLTANTIINSEKLKVSSLRSVTSQECSCRFYSA